MILRSLFARAVFPSKAEVALLREFFGTMPGVFIEVGANDPLAVPMHRIRRRLRRLGFSRGGRGRGQRAGAASAGR